MDSFFEEELGRTVDFAQSGRQTEESLKIGGGRDKGPSTRQSSEKWVNWDQSEWLGQPFDVNKISISKLEQMQRDPILSFGLTFIKVPLIRAPWYIKSTDPQRAAFVDNCLRKIYGRFILAYTNSLSFGYSAMVKKFELVNPDWTYLDTKNPNEENKESLVWGDKSVDAVIWKPFTALNPRHVVPAWTKAGDFNGIDYTPGDNSTFNFMPPEKKTPKIPLPYALWATNEKDSVNGSIYGYPRLGYAYRYWWSYWYKFGLSDRAFEKWADPPVIVHHPAMEGVGPDGEIVNFSEKALQTAESARSGANIAVPTMLATAGMEEKGTNVQQWSIDQMKSEVNFDALADMFKYLDIQKLRSMMVPEQSIIEGNSSARNVAKEFGDIFQESQAVIMEEIDDQINRYMIPQLLELNFGPGGATCTKVTTGFDPQDREAMQILVQAVANKNGGIPEVDLRSTLSKLGIPLLSPEEATNRIQEMAKLDTELAKQKFETLARESALKGHKPPETAAMEDFAGIDENGLYFSGRDVIEFIDSDRSTMRKIFDKILGRTEEKEVI